MAMLASMKPIQVRSYFAAGTNLMYGVGAIVGLIGAVKIYQKWNSGDPDTRKVAAAWFSIYVALLYEYSMRRYQNPVIIKRNIVMKRSKIRSRTTYDKCFHDLDSYGYLEYKPSYDYGGSYVNMIELA